MGSVLEIRLNFAIGKEMILVLSDVWHWTNLNWVYHDLICQNWRHLVTKVAVKIYQQIRRALLDAATYESCTVAPVNDVDVPYKEVIEVEVL